MKPSSIWLRSRFAPGPMGRAVSATDYDMVLTGDIDAFKPNGARLLSVRRGVIRPESIQQAAATLDLMKQLKSHNRAVAAGNPVLRTAKLDGRRTNTHQTYDAIPSGVVGFFNRYPRADFCRELSFNAGRADAFTELQPLLFDIAKGFVQAVPERFKAQMSVVAKTSPDFVLKNERGERLPWTTITVNHNWQTFLHVDKGDLDEGFSCLTAVRRGSFNGGLLVVPSFRVAVELRTGDALFMDAHEPHANTPFSDCSADYERISLVLYYRTRMQECGSASEELDRVKNLRGSLEEEVDDDDQGGE